MSNPVEVLILGAGSRGAGYAEFAKSFPDRMKVIGVAEPREYYREKLAQAFDIPRENVFDDWRKAAERDRFADVAIVATQDAMHEEPAVQFANKKYNILLEKPMAPTEQACRNIVKAVEENDVTFGVCHVLRYTQSTAAIKRLIDEGAIGDVVSIQRLEPVGYWHQAHSFVRGNWRNEAESANMLLAKSCHDLDWIRYIMGVPCKKVSSFGSLRHFRKAEQPKGAADRCINCGVESTCPYSAKKIYMRFFNKGLRGWPLDVIAEDVTEEAVMAAIRKGPYGRCVYACDNDVVDNQIVNMQFEGGRTASFVMMAFTKNEDRRTTIFGTRGELITDGRHIKVFDFLTEETNEIDSKTSEMSVLGGHGGGDFGIMDAYIRAIAENDRSYILSGPKETLESHLMVFASERARLHDTVEKINVK
jgi:predicted dehydrogenase